MSLCSRFDPSLFLFHCLFLTKSLSFSSVLCFTPSSSLDFLALLYSRRQTQLISISFYQYKLALSFFLIQNPLILYPKEIVSRLTLTGYVSIIDHPSSCQHSPFLFPEISLLLLVRSRVSFIFIQILQFNLPAPECLTSDIRSSWRAITSQVAITSFFSFI